MTTVLERVARAMWEQRRKKAAEDFPTLPPLDEWGDDGAVPRANGIMEEARAGLEAMRVVSAEVEHAGHLTMPVEFNLKIGGLVDIKLPHECVKASSVLNAMLDAILAEVPK